jgi:hypothetical protein
MNKRTLLIFLAWILCFGTAWAVLAQRRELVRLRAQREQLTEPATVNHTRSEIDDSKSSVSPGTLSDVDSRELLRLRSQITRLNARKRELADVVEIHQRLRGELDNGPTNAVGNRLPPGYIRKSEAQFAGYSTPENTVVSFLWALHHHDANGLLQSFSADMSAKIEASGGTDSFFKSADPMPGLAIRGRNNLPDGSVELEVEFDPSMPTDKLHIRPFNGEWKLDSLF